MPQPGEPEGPRLTKAKTAGDADAPSSKMSEANRRRSSGMNPSKPPEEGVLSDLPSESADPGAQTSDGPSLGANSGEPSQVARSDNDGNIDSSIDKSGDGEAEDKRDSTTNGPATESAAPDPKITIIVEDSSPSEKSNPPEEENVEQKNPETSSNEDPNSNNVAGTDVVEGNDRGRGRISETIIPFVRNISRSLSRSRFLRGNVASEEATKESEEPSAPDSTKKTHGERTAKKNSPAADSNTDADTKGSQSTKEDQPDPENAKQRFTAKSSIESWTDLLARINQPSAWFCALCGVLLAFPFLAWILQSRQSSELFIYEDPFMPHRSAAAPLLSTEGPDQLLFEQSTPEEQTFYLMRQFRSMQALSVETLARFGAVADYCEVLKFAPDTLKLYTNNESSPLWLSTTDPTIRRDARILEPLAKELHTILTSRSRFDVPLSKSLMHIRNEKLRYNTPSSMVDDLKYFFRFLSIYQAEGYQALTDRLFMRDLHIWPFAIRRLFTSSQTTDGHFFKGRNAELSRFYKNTSDMLLIYLGAARDIQNMSVNPAMLAAREVLLNPRLRQLTRKPPYNFGWGIPTNIFWAVRRTYIFLLAELGIATYGGNDAPAHAVAEPNKRDHQTSLPDPWFQDLYYVADGVVRCDMALSDLLLNLWDLVKAANASAWMVAGRPDERFKIPAEFSRAVVDASGKITESRVGAGGNFVWSMGEAPMLWPLMFVEPHVPYRAAGMAM